MQNTDKKMIYSRIVQQISVFMENLDREENNLDASSIESGLLSMLLSIGRESFEYKMRLEQERIDSQKSVEKSGFIMICKGLEERQYCSIFGQIAINRKRYYHKEIGNFHPFDEIIGLPTGKMSYLLKDWLGSQASEEDYRQSVNLLNEIFNLKIHENESRRNVEHLSPFVDDFYAQKEITEVPVGNIICFQSDGKGVPVIKKERDTSIELEDNARLMKGEKRGIKKTATVSVTSHLRPQVRDKESVLRGLFREDNPTKDSKDTPRQDSNWHEDIHRRALMNNQKGSINTGIERVKQMHTSKKSDIVVLIDAGSGLEKNIRLAIEAAGLTLFLKSMTLDILHVSEYVWKAANAVLGEKSSLRTQWVREVLSDLLENKTEKVILQLKSNILKGNLKDTAKSLLGKTITYFENHKHMMDYKTCLEKGYPISTALAESSCGHLVKDRMEHSGMRWSIKGAQNILDIRAVKKNGDWPMFMQFIKNNKLACAA
jgi:hypothetical protein